MNIFLKAFLLGIFCARGDVSDPLVGQNDALSGSCNPELCYAEEVFDDRKVWVCTFKDDAHLKRCLSDVLCDVSSQLGLRHLKNEELDTEVDVKVFVPEIGVIPFSTLPRMILPQNRSREYKCNNIESYFDETVKKFPVQLFYSMPFFKDKNRPAVAILYGQDASYVFFSGHDLQKILSAMEVGAYHAFIGISFLVVLTIGTVAA